MAQGHSRNAWAAGLKPRPTQSRDPAPVQGQSGLDTPRPPRLVSVVDGGRFARSRG